jgi:hypothetical protein
LFHWFALISTLFYDNHHHMTSTMTSSLLRHVTSRTLVREGSYLSAAWVRPSSSTTTSSPGFFGRVQNAFIDRQKKSQQQQLAEALEKMADSPVWTIKDFSEDLERNTKGWRAMLPGVSNELKMVKETVAIAKAVIEEMGEDVTMEELMDMSRIQKLRVSVNSEASVEDVNLMLKQFQAVDIMHQVLRRRKMEGKPIPTDEHSVQTIMQTEGMKSMTKSQRSAMRKSYMKKAGMHGMKR